MKTVHIVPLILLFFMTCSPKEEFKPQTGDLLFQDVDCGPFCDAIEKVTIGVYDLHFSHVGIFVHLDSGDFVLEAIDNGVVLSPFDSFLNRSKDKVGTPKVVAGRIKKQLPWQHHLSGILATYLHKEYDPIFDIANDSYYCSELVYMVSKDLNKGKPLFNLEPMTFKDPETHQFFPAWTSYFEKLGHTIPEGAFGLNPGGISRSPNVEIIHRYY